MEWLKFLIVILAITAPFFIAGAYLDSPTASKNGKKIVFSALSLVCLAFVYYYYIDPYLIKMEKIQKDPCKYQEENELIGIYPELKYVQEKLQKELIIFVTRKKPSFDCFYLLYAEDSQLLYSCLENEKIREEKELEQLFSFMKSQEEDFIISCREIAKYRVVK